MLQNMPLASEGFNSYRYKGVFGYIMIGANSTEDALSQAKLSFGSKSEACVDKLEIWDESKNVYVKVD